MAEDDVDKLKLFWDHFFKAETGTYEKTTWLDLFLAEFLIRVKDGANPKELIKFCPVSGVVTLVGCELLCGIHRVTSSINTHYSPPLPTLDSPTTHNIEDNRDNAESEEKSSDSGSTESRSLFARANALSSSEVLKKYLVGGVAWRCLALLSALGVEGLSCCRQLSSVLIWLYGEVGAAWAAPAAPAAPAAASPGPAAPAAPPAPVLPLVARVPTLPHLLFSNRIWAKQKPLLSNHGPKAFNMSPEKSYSRSRYTSHCETDRARRKAGRRSELSSESGASDEDLQALNRTLAIKVSAPPDHFEYYNSSLRSSNDLPDSYSEARFSPRRQKPRVDDYTTDRHREIIAAEISPFEFTQLSIELLASLCRAESGVTGAEGSQISMQCIGFALRTLCSLQFASQPAQPHHHRRLTLQLHLLELLMVALDRVLPHPDLCAKLIHGGVLPMLVRFLEDLLTKTGSKRDGYRHIEAAEADVIVKLAFGGVYSALAFLHCLLIQCRTVDRLREFADQFRLYGEGLRGALLAETVDLMLRLPPGEPELADSLVKRLVDGGARLVAAMKRVRGSVLHGAACGRRRHRACRARVAAGLLHHHDVLGAPGAADCCVARLYGALAALLALESVAVRGAVRGRTLRALAAGGACCCYPPGALAERCVRLAARHAGAARAALRLLERGGWAASRGAAAARLPCAVCEAAPRRARASFLLHYNSLLAPDNAGAVLRATVRHLLRVAPACRADLRAELLFGVVYPTFIVAKHRYLVRGDDASFFLTSACLSMIAMLLDSVSFAERFVAKGGLTYVVELLTLPEFAARCCAILEVAIVVEIWKLMREGGTVGVDTGSLGSVRTLWAAVSEATDACLEVYRRKLPADEYSTATEVRAETQALALVPARRPSYVGSVPSNLGTDSDRPPLTDESSLSGAATFWRCCASLCLYSPWFRAAAASEPALAASYSLLKLALHRLTRPASDVDDDIVPQETKHLVKIVESLLTAQLALADVTSGVSKETSCQLVRSALCGATGAGSGGAARTAALCDALIRAAPAAPSLTHTMPKLNTLKVPPLACSSGGSSECSSSEESSAGGGLLYDTDRSDSPTRPDDGYEADIEIGKFDLLPSYKNRKTSLDMDIIDTEIQSPILESVSEECRQYTKNGELAHPELCIIVVDILTQLIDKAMKSCGTGSESAAGVSLARACAARLAAALPARAHHPPPALLARLLAPPVQDLLGQHHPTLQELQERVLELVVAIGSRRLSGAELATLLRLFTRPSPPLSPLLATLHRLLPQHLHPQHILTFPVVRDLSRANKEMKHLGADYVHLTSTGVSSQSHAADAFAAQLQEAHLAKGHTSCWSRSAARVGVAAGWAPWLAGFAAHLWLATHTHTDNTDNSVEMNGDSSDSESNRPISKSDTLDMKREHRAELLHVFSIGTESLMFEMWLEPNTGALTLRLSRPESAGCRVVSTARVAGVVSGRSACVAVNVADTLHRRTMQLQVTIFVNGYQLETVSLAVQGILVRKAAASHVLVGAVCGNNAGSPGAYHMADFAVYRAPVFTSPLALHLAAHGPDSSCMVKCEAPNFPPLLTPELLDSDIDWDQVFDMPESRLRSFHESVLLKISAHAPTIANLYHHTAPPAFPSRVGAASGSGVASAASIPEALFLTWSGSALASRHHGLLPALHTLDTVDPLLCLYSRVVQLGGSEAEQAAALGLVLRARSLDGRLHAAWARSSAADMVLAVAGGGGPSAAPPLLRAALAAATSAPVLRGIVVDGNTTAAITDPDLLALVVRAHNLLDDSVDLEWEVEGTGPRSAGSAWSLALCMLRVLVRGGHPRREFNLQQMQRVGLLDLLLLACKERFLNGTGCGLGPPASRSLVQLVRGLLGAPPALARAATLADFLLLMHQASETFVTHSRANFYFLLTPEPAEMSEFPRRAPRPRAARVPPPPDADADTDNIDASTDSTKVMKGIINAQIREARKHNMSSTSEASDTTADAGENSESESARGTEESSRGEANENGDTGDDGGLHEYIVVEEEEVKHTTVEMYSSGIYTQETRVKAGAAGFAASAGLLLLLRDALLQLPDSDLQQLQAGVCGVVSAEALCALANHRDGDVRAAVISAAAALLRRLPADVAKRLRHQHYYIHLADQISLYEGTWELAEACAAFITDRDLALEDQLDEEVWATVTPEGIARAPPLLALLAVSAHDAPLAHNLARLISRLIDKASLKQISEIYLMEAVVRAVRAVGAREEGEEGRALLLQDLDELLAAIADKVQCTPHSAQTLVELHHMLTYVEWAAGGASGAGGAASAARAANSTLYLAEVELLERRLRHDKNKTNNYFATVLTSAVVGATGNGDPAAKLVSVATRGVAHLTSGGAGIEPGTADTALARRLLDALSRASGGPRRGEAGAALCELAGWALVRRDAVAALRALHAAPPAALPAEPPALRRLAVYVLSAVRAAHAAGDVELPVTDWARGWALALQAGLPARLAPDTLAVEAAAYRATDEERWARAAAKLRPTIAKAVFKSASVALRVAESAMAATRVAVEAQNAERKRFMEQLRGGEARQAGATAAWERVAATHAHERGACHDAGAAPRAWALDPTEGPGRVRVRLRRAALRVPPRLLQPAHRHKAEVPVGPPPPWAARRCALPPRLRLHETVAHMSRCTRVTVAADTRGELLLSDRCVHFVPDVGAEGAVAWPLDAVLRVATRRWCLREVAVELFLSSGHAHLLAFVEPADRAAFLKALAACHLPAKIEPDSLAEAMTAWRNGTITNWEYLMRLNGLAGRSYNDLMQYPILPFVLADYTSRILDLGDPASFRDLSRPMAVQNKSREQHYINIYNDLKLARREGCSPLLSRQPHHYASLYSNSGGVLHYLVRVSPFTELFLNYQDNNFDMPDRTFHSLATTWRLITRDSPTDVKELIPEMFYLAELFTNREGLELGVRQCGQPVDHVELPPWAADPRLFTLIHRQAVESRAVTETLAHWVDLVFGHKQVGPAAVDAINVFPACTYYGFDPEALEDEVDRTAAAAMVRTYGQAPRQLLRQPHPQRQPDLNEARPEPQVWAGVRGARWGSYAGSPALPGAAPAARRALAGACGVQALPAPRSAAAAPRRALLVRLAAEGEAPPPPAVLSWGHSDDVVRVKRRRDAAPEPLLHAPPPERVTCAAASCLCETSAPTLLGLASGRVLALRLRVRGGGVRVRARSLLAHFSPISALHVCPRSSLVVTASEDGVVVLWDMNELTYIRTLPNRDMSRVTAVTVSPTLSDVATVHAASPRTDSASTPPAEPLGTNEYEDDDKYKYKSLLRVHTVNAVFVGSVKVPEEVLCVCYSGAAEGVSVNSIAAGLASGAVRLYSSWDLRPTILIHAAVRAPLLSVSYSSDSSLLFGCYEGGTVVAWESIDGGTRPQPVRLHPAHALT